MTGIGDQITIQNKALDIIWMNQPAKDIWGDVIDKKCYKVYKGLDVPCPDCYVETMFNEGRTVVSEQVDILPDGRRTPILVTSSPVRDAEGNIVAIVDVGKDITERKLLERKQREYAENLEKIVEKRKELEKQLKEYTENLEKIVEERTKALKESKGKLQAILTGIGDQITIQNKDLDIIWVNQPIKDIWGDVIDKKCYEVYKGLDAPCPDCYFETVFNEGKTVVSERVSVLLDGRSIPVLVTSSPVRDAEGHIVAVVEVFKDITERKLLEKKLKDYAENLEKIVEERTKALKESEEKLKAMLAGIGDQITIQNKALDIIWMNQPMKDVWGDVIGKKCYEAYKGLDERCPDCYFETVFNEGKTVISERVNILPEGRRSHILVTSSPVRDAEGSIVAIVEVAKDITERQELEQMKTQFINVAAHELRTPLSALKAHVELLEITSKNMNLPADVNRRIGIISRNAKRLAVLINNLLDYSHLEAGTIKPKMALGSLKTVAIQTVKEVFPLALKHRHILKLTTPKMLPFIYLDKEIIHRIFGNLLSNAIKYTLDGGTIDITLLEEAENLHVTVKDTGIGIAEEDLEKIFQPFHVADIPESVHFPSEFERTGLGLAITKRYVTMHGGKIWAESRIGEGSTFHMLLPKVK